MSAMTTTMCLPHYHFRLDVYIMNDSIHLPLVLVAVHFAKLPLLI